MKRITSSINQGIFFFLCSSLFLAASSASASTCFESSISAPAPFLGNNNELFRLSNGVTGQIKFEYNYFYDYYPTVIICPDSLVMYHKGKKLSVSNLSNTGGITKNVSVIESRINGTFDGFEFGKLFKLMNGQIFEQTTSRYSYSYRLNPDVFIVQRGSQYSMQVDGTSDSVNVKLVTGQSQPGGGGTGTESSGSGLPNALTGLAISAYEFTKSFLLTWSYNSGATSYDVYYSTTADGEKQLLGNTTSTNSTINNVNPGQYYFHVYPVNSIGKGTGMSVLGTMISANRPPIVTILGGNRSIADTNALPGERVSFSGIASDSDGTIQKTEWLVGSQVVGTVTSVSLDLVDGSTTVTFRATDNSGAITSATAVITVAAPIIPNKAPTVAISDGNRSIADTDGLPGERVSFSATAADSDGTIQKTEWLVGSQILATGTSINLNLADGSTTVIFRATDNSGASTSATAVITVAAPVIANKAPTVAIVGGNRSIADTNSLPGERLSFSGIASDSDGTIQKTEWLVGSQVVGTGTSVSLDLVDGSTTVTFRATDDDGSVTESSVAINIMESTKGNKSDWLGSFNNVLLPEMYNLNVNSVGVILVDRARLHSCVKIYSNSIPAKVEGMHEIDVTFDIVSIEQGIIRLILSRAFAESVAVNNSRPDCSGSFDTTTGLYRDFIKLENQLYDTVFKLVDEGRLEFILTSGNEVMPTLQ